MNLPDYPAAREALAALLVGHQTQHRCTDGTYYSTTAAAACPTRTAVATILDTLLTAETAPHVAAHDDTAVYTVAAAMVRHPDGEAVVLAYLDPPQRSWWIEKARQAMEAHAALLDASVTA
jgi:hypothetical protein